MEAIQDEQKKYGAEEEYDDDEDDEYEDGTIRLREGLDIEQLCRGEGDTFTIEVGDTDGADEKRYFDPDAIFKGTESHIPGWGDESDEDENDEDSPFDKLERKMDVLVKDEDGFVLKKMKKPGVGLKVNENAHVRVHYSGFLEYADEPFDSTRMQRGMKNFKLGSGDVIFGLDVAVRSMKKGEIAEFLFSSDYGFGPRGCPPRIPPRATLFFEVELIDFNVTGGADDYFAMSYAQRKEAGLGVLKPMADTEKKKGNSFYKSQRYHIALRHYKKAILILEECRLKDETDEKEQQRVLLSLYLNSALAAINLGRNKETITFCHKALDIQRGCAKALYLKGKALCHLGEFDRARSNLLAAQRIKPNDPDINKQLDVLAKQQKRMNAEEISMYQKMLGVTVEDRETEDEQRNPEITEDVCTDYFQKTATETLQKFLEGESDVLPLNFGKFTKSELSFIEATSKKIGLRFNKHGEGSNTHFRVTKVKQEEHT